MESVRVGDSHNLLAISRARFYHIFHFIRAYTIHVIVLLFTHVQPIIDLCAYGCACPSNVEIRVRCRTVGRRCVVFCINKSFTGSNEILMKLQ